MTAMPRNLGDDWRPKRRHPESRWAQPGMVERCKALYVDQGVSATKTAAQLGEGFTRNMVIGLGYREGWTRSPEIQRQNAVAGGKATAKLVAERRPKPPKPASGPTLPPRVKVDQKALTAPLDVTNARPWTEREIGQCAWPIEIDGETYSCCAEVGHDSPNLQYCPQHKKRLYQPTAKGKRRMTATELARSCRRYA